MVSVVVVVEKWTFVKVARETLAKMLVSGCGLVVKERLVVKVAVVVLLGLACRA